MSPFTFLRRLFHRKPKPVVMLSPAPYKFENDSDRAKRADRVSYPKDAKHKEAADSKKEHMG